MKKVKLVRVHQEYDYGDSETIASLTAESEWLEVTDEEYNLLTDYRIRNKILASRYGSYSDRLILLEEKTQELPALIKSASDILGKILEKEKADKEKAAKAAKIKREKAEATKIAKAKELLRKAGELK